MNRESSIRCLLFERRHYLLMTLLNKKFLLFMWQTFFFYWNFLLGGLGGGDFAKFLYHKLNKMSVEWPFISNNNSFKNIIYYIFPFQCNIQTQWVRGSVLLLREEWFLEIYLFISRWSQITKGVQFFCWRVQTAEKCRLWQKAAQKKRGGGRAGAEYVRLWLINPLGEPAPTLVPW